MRDKEKQPKPSQIKEFCVRGIMRDNTKGNTPVARTCAGHTGAQHPFDIQYWTCVVKLNMCAGSFRTLSFVIPRYPSLSLDCPRCKELLSFVVPNCLSLSFAAINSGLGYPASALKPCFDISCFLGDLWVLTKTCLRWNQWHKRFFQDKLMGRFTLMRW